MKPRPWHPNRPTPKMVKAAFAAQAPLDRETKPLAKRPVLKPNYGKDGLGGTDGGKK